MAAERACGLTTPSELGAEIVDRLIGSKTSFYVSEMERHGKQAPARKRRQEEARRELPRAKKGFRWAFRKIKSTENLTDEEEAAVNEALGDYFRTKEDASGRDRWQEQRVKHVFRTSPTQASFDNPPRSTLLTELLLVPVWELIERHGAKLSERRVAQLVHEIVVSFLPLALTQGLTVEAVRKRTNDALLRKMVRSADKES
jgi:hypothetical protein